MKFCPLIHVTVVLLAGADLRTISDVQGSGVRYRSLIGKMSDREFAEMASQFLGSEKIVLGKIVVYGSPAARVLAGPLGYDHCGYDSWRLLIQQHDVNRSGCPEVREAVKIGSNVIVRTLNEKCRREKYMLLGSGSPLDLVVEGKKVEILDVSVSGGSRDDGIGVHLYVRTKGAVSQELARHVTAQIQAATGVRNLVVALRADKWFFNDCDFPALFPFEVFELPSKEEYSHTKYAACSVSGSWPIQCFESVSHVLQ